MPKMARKYSGPLRPVLAGWTNRGPNKDQTPRHFKIGSKAKTL